MPPHHTRLSSFSDFGAYNVPNNHPSKSLWLRKENSTKNCFALAAILEYKQTGGTVDESQKRLLRSLRGPVRVTTFENEVYKLHWQV
eukprot:3884305-Amphidinium_carterae.6